MGTTTGTIKYSLKELKNRLVTPNKTLTYAQVQNESTISIQDLAKHISDHNSKYNRADVVAVIISVVDCTKEFLLEGHKVQLGELGTFYNCIKSKGAESALDFNAGVHITKLRAGFTPGPLLKDYLGEATFEYAPKRANQQLLMAAEKAGSGTLTLSSGGSGSGSGGGNGDDEGGEIVGN